MPDSSPTALMSHEADFDQLCHDLKNPLMVIRGRAQLVERVIQRSADLPDVERSGILQSLAAIEAAVVGIVEMIDDAGPPCLVSSAGRKPTRMEPYSP